MKTKDVTDVSQLKVGMKVRVKSMKEIIEIGCKGALNKDNWRYNFKEIFATPMDEFCNKWYTIILPKDNNIYLYDNNVGSFCFDIRCLEIEEAYDTEEEEENTSLVIQMISRDALKKIVDIACVTWKSKLIKKAESTNALDSHIRFTSKEVSEMFDAANVEQTKLLKEYFTDPRVKRDVLEVVQKDGEDEYIIKINNKSAMYLYLESKYSRLVHLCSTHGTWTDSNGNVLQGFLKFTPK